MASIILFVFASFIFSTAAAQQGNTLISPGSFLTPTNNSYWSSGSGHFAFGFHNNGNQYSVSIWLPKIQQKTVIWTAKGDKPFLTSDVTLNLTTNGRLILQHSEGQQEIIANTPQPVSSASMLNSGNFVLYNSDSEILWQTFRLPTDTILPGQTLVAGDKLVSAISETDQRSENFQLFMQADGNLVLYPGQGIPASPKTAYWDSGTYTSGNTTSLNLSSNGWLYLQNETGIIVNLAGGKNESGEAIYRATVDADGIFRLYSHSLEQNGNWSIEWWSSANRCDPIGICGLNSYCILVSQEPECTCPPGFSFYNPEQKDLGCNRSSSADTCMTTEENAFIIEELDNVLWEENPYNSLCGNEIQCREECLKDCECEAALFSNQKCKLQRLPLRFGRTKIQQANPVSTFIKVYNGGLGTNTTGNKGKNELERGILITGIVLSTLACILLACFGFLVFRYRVWQYKKVSGQGNVELFEDVTPQLFSYDELKIATNNFTNEIGKGAFATVFRGVTPNGRRNVAVKRLEKLVAEGEREFKNEMKVIGRTHHKNLVQLLGYCHDGTNMLLVYEYMSNGSLSDYLFKSETKPAWEERITIVLNVARGLLYLHEECATQIIHCDIKPENILMDENGCPKIADFGLSKLLMPNQSKTYTGLRGTRGYVAPEWHRTSPVTVKVDVYSFGIMLLEIICCRRSVNFNVPYDEEILEIWVYNCYKANELNNLVRDEEVETCQIDRMVRVGLWCIQDEPSLRPSMKKVVLMLEGTVEIPAPPSSFVSSI